MDIPLVCTALLGLLLFGQGLHVSLTRRLTGRIIGHDNGPTDAMHRAVRAHANTAEYAPYLAILFLWHGTHHPAQWIVAVIVVATVSRFSLVIGLLWGGPLDKPNWFRFFGALTTYICGIVLAAAVLM